MLNKLLKRCMPWMDKGRWYHVSFRWDHNTVAFSNIKAPSCLHVVPTVSGSGGNVEIIPLTTMRVVSMPCHVQIEADAGYTVGATSGQSVMGSTSAYGPILRIDDEGGMYLRFPITGYSPSGTYHVYMFMSLDNTTREGEG